MPQNIMPGEHDWMYGVPGMVDPGVDPRMGFPSPAAPAQPNFMSKLTAALGGPQGLLNLGANLMAAGGPSPQRTSLGQALGGGLLANQQFQQQQSDNQLKTLLLKSQIEKAKQQAAPKRYVVKGALLDESGNPIYEAPASAGSGIGNYQPGDYTPASWAKFLKSNDPAELERYQTPRQEYSPSFQNVTRTNPDGSTQAGTFDTRTGAYNWTGEVIPAGAKAKADAAARAEGQITGARAGKAPNAYAAYQAGVKGLESAMSQTATGPIAGRLPTLTANQQIAEGAEATMAPILKQLFRDAGEGTFTDSDQALLMRMVPTRTDHPEARKAKLAMIDEIVRAKLGISGAVAPAAQDSAPGIDALLNKYAPQ
jgi:hypothetical protein